MASDNLVSITINDKSLRQSLNALEMAATDMTPAMRKIAGTLLTETQLNFLDEGRPDWIPSLAAEERDGQTLQDTGRLMSSINTRSDSRQAAIGTNVVYAAIHQFGGEVKHKERQQDVHYRQNKDGSLKRTRQGASDYVESHKVSAYSTEMPARPYLPITGDGELQPEAEKSILDTIVRHLESAARR
ncbi:phage virion morphogenesis protein [Citrobacter koseri]|uniref:phage virion morphogenesis protein n=1 Tax=Citrobacter koseri TaxID=545 RepID=UPI0023AEF420|nr:phage virion morphogenesis protein [Citrobacter koseri]EKW1006041.1 phage virion morphogenesis protein [Citrobacter koseri]HEM8507419.1 phage virion morphogenesis protein [Citrobacter koseri]HEM8573787.1 phage virion morphogenesis protein [Citrobacter koseri]